MAHPDSTPIHIGLDQEKQVDLRVTFPGRELEVKNAAAVGRFQIGAEGKLSAMK